MQFTRRLLSGLLTFVPGGRLLSERSTGGSGSARYCYWVWLHHLVLARRNGLPANPRVVAELGPGDSLGTGIAALLGGVDRYYAFDVISYSQTERELQILEQLRQMYGQRLPPTDDDFDRAMFRLASFPDEIPPADLERALREERVEAIRAAIQNLGEEQDGIVAAYEPSWLEAKAAPGEQAELLVSQAVLEHVDDLPGAYRAMYDWTAPGGMISHEIDFRSHNFARDWNGHWSFSDASWALIRGRRRYAINREPLSTHLRLTREAGFRIVDVKRAIEPSAIGRDRLASRFASLDDEDLTTKAVLIQAVKD
jgi:hypothetical protein